MALKRRMFAPLVKSRWTGSVQPSYATAMVMPSPLVALASALALFAAPVGAAAPAKAPDWSKTVVDTGIGWRMGNPAAATKLVEYGSFNCPHCAEFEKGAMPKIIEMVAAGKLSFEFRPKQLFPHDPSATLLALCAGDRQAFAFTEDYMKSAPDVLARLRAAYKADTAPFDAADAAGPAASATFMAKTGEMGPIAARHGVSAAKAAQCLSDPKLLKRVEDNEAAALAAGVRGTPTFFINGAPATSDDLVALGIPVAL